MTRALESTTHPLLRTFLLQARTSPPLKWTLLPLKRTLRPLQTKFRPLDRSHRRLKCARLWLKPATQGCVAPSCRVRSYHSGLESAAERPCVAGVTHGFDAPWAGSVALRPRRYNRLTLAFRVLIIGGTGQVGTAVVQALIAEPSCNEIVMVTRKASPWANDPRVRQVVMDTAASEFPDEVQTVARAIVAHGDVVYGASCVGVGSGSLNWTEEQLKALELGVVGAFARGCLAGGITRFALLSAAGSNTKSRIRYARMMGSKEELVRGIGFERLAIFRPGIIAGNTHTPGYVALLGRLVPGPFGTIEQRDIGRAFVGEFVANSSARGVVFSGNAAMRQMSRTL